MNEHEDEGKEKVSKKEKVYNTHTKKISFFVPRAWGKNSERRIERQKSACAQK